MSAQGCRVSRATHSKMNSGTVRLWKTRRKSSSSAWWQAEISWPTAAIASTTCSLWPRPSKTRTPARCWGSFCWTSGMTSFRVPSMASPLEKKVLSLSSTRRTIWYTRPSMRLYTASIPSGSGLRSPCRCRLAAAATKSEVNCLLIQDGVLWGCFRSMKWCPASIPLCTFFWPVSLFLWCWWWLCPSNWLGRSPTRSLS